MAKTKINEDEELARKLQAEFDREDLLCTVMQKEDAAIARTLAKAHSISDSDDSTDDPGNSTFDGSQDLFEASTSTYSDKSHQRNATKEGSSPTSPYDVDTDIEEEEERKEIPIKSKPVCKYGSKCYRKNISHLEEFYHPRKRHREKEDKGSPPPVKVRKREGSGVRTAMDVVEQCQPFSLFLTKVADIPSKYNSTGALNLKDILSESLGKLKQSCHFNFMFDMNWLTKQYPESFRKLPLLLVHGEQGKDELNMKAEASQFSNISLCRAPLDIPYGTHHTVWVSPLFPRLTSPGQKGDSLTGFKTDLLRYLAAYRAAKLAPWERIIQEHDMSQANVFLIGSVPGRHALNNKHIWGHLRLRKVLKEHGPDEGVVKHWSLCGQFSSIGSLGPTPEAWLLTEFSQSLVTCCNTSLPSPVPKAKVRLIFPSKDNIRLSLEGYNGGGCVPYSIKTASKQPWLTPFFCQWKSEGRGRSRAVPHIKSYSRFSPDGTQAAWFLVTSANLSKAAWGALEKQGSQLMIRSYELGVMFLPQYFGCKNSFRVSSSLEDLSEPSANPVFPLPYELPPTAYVKGDRPWFIDVPCVDQPDTFGTKWCPAL